MSEISGVDTAVIECGLCLRHDKSLEKPHVSPCKHVQCLPCLQRYAQIHNRFQCLQPNCREVFDETQLSEFPLTSSNSKQCGKCLEKNLSKILPTKFFCVQCSLRLCTDHKVDHDCWYKVHEVVEISHYDAQSTKLEKRSCKTHTKEVYTDGCTQCLVIACPKCWRTERRCFDDQDHCWRDLEMLVGKLKPEMEEQIQKLSSKVQQLTGQLTSALKILQEFDASTETQLLELEKVRENKILQITTEYKLRKADLEDRRNQEKENLKIFTEKSLPTKIAELNTSILVLTTRLEHSHNVDIVKTYSEMKWRVKCLIEADIPNIQVDEPKMAPLLGENCGSSDDGLGLRFSLPSEYGSDNDGVSNLPSLELEKTVRLESFKPMFTSYYRGNAYIASDSVCDIKQISRNSQITTCCALRKPSCGIVVSKNLTYFMTNSSPPAVHVFHQTNEVQSWRVASTHSVYCRFAIIEDEVVILDGFNKTLLVYSLEGKFLRNLRLSGKLSDNRMNSVCAAEDGDILICDYTSSRVFKVSVLSSQVRWSCGIIEPIGVASDSKHVFVATFRRNILNILDLKTGRIMSEIEIKGLNNEGTVNVHISEETLVVTRYREGKAMFFKIRYDDISNS